MQTGHCLVNCEFMVGTTWGLVPRHLDDRPMMTVSTHCGSARAMNGQQEEQMPWVNCWAWERLM